MPRPAKPIEVHIANGNMRRLSSSQIADRIEMEAASKSGVNKLTASQTVKDDAIALQMHKQLSKLYKKISYIDALDDNVVNRYCLMHSEATVMENLISAMQDDVDECDEPSDRIALYKTIVSATRNLNSLRAMMLQLEDRLFLNPTARLKNVPKAEKKKDADPDNDLYGSTGA